MASAPGRRSPNPAARRTGLAGRRLLDTYAVLATRGEHLLHDLLGGQVPRQWQHYPEDDSIDPDGGYQWFYHSHSPEDRPEAAEHGHFHLFARRPLWSRRMQSKAERAFAALTGNPGRQVATRHLLAVGMDAKGLPVSLFTVNSWVTGDLMLSASGTARILADMHLRTGHDAIDTVLECVVALCMDEIRMLLGARDTMLSAWKGRAVLEDTRLEILSHQAIALDAKLNA
ncbi:hypothetical protein R2APBS1_3808 [Rhodanobacter denitrificans]|uniref:DUF6969 domain-containing protein n=2 Tax=Rhodanobacteraceae TaxID=1775411 RepID=M4NTQ1_9GAMM|nr:hypothetical protein R2APBS1_3808 [Rhodanobacter denitrificans]